MTRRLPNLLIQDLPHFPCQVMHCKRLLDVIYSFFQNAMMDNGMVGVTRHIENLHLWIKRFGTLSQLTTTHPGHHHIRQ